MAISRREENRALSGDERDLVEKSHHPDVQALPDVELGSLLRLIRDRRDKARTEAHRQRRELRGKAAPKGVAPAARDDGTRNKLAVLANAMRRLNAEQARRERMASRGQQAQHARRALKLKQDGDADDAGGPAFNSRAANSGMRKVPNRKARDLVRPMELGRQRQAAKIAQAKKDNRSSS